jgi:ribosomal protein L24
MYRRTKPLPQDKNKNPLEVGDRVNICGGKYNGRSGVIKKTMTVMANVRLDGAVEPVRVKMTNMTRHFESNEKEVDFIGFKVMKEDLPMPSIIMEEVFESHPEFGNALMKMGRVMRASGITFGDEDISFLVGIMAMDC